MNLDFSAEPLFSWYVVLLAVSGAVMLALATVRSSGQSTGMRIFNALVGAAFLGYGFYLGFIFQGGSYVVFFKAFFVPVLLIINFFKSMAARRRVPVVRQQAARQPQSPQDTFEQPTAPAPGSRGA